MVELCGVINKETAFINQDADRLNVIGSHLCQVGLDKVGKELQFISATLKISSKAISDALSVSINRQFKAQQEASYEQMVGIVNLVKVLTDDKDPKKGAS